MDEGLFEHDFYIKYFTDFGKAASILSEIAIDEFFLISTLHACNKTFLKAKK
jgi:hypothetical protein